MGKQLAGGDGMQGGRVGGWVGFWGVTAGLQLHWGVLSLGGGVWSEMRRCKVSPEKGGGQLGRHTRVQTHQLARRLTRANLRSCTWRRGVRWLQPAGGGGCACRGAARAAGERREAQAPWAVSRGLPGTLSTPVPRSPAATLCLVLPSPMQVGEHGDSLHTACSTGPMTHA